MAYAVAHGAKVTEIPKTEWPAWEEYVGPLEAIYIKKAEAKGLPGAEYLRYFKERIKYWEAKSPDEKALREWAKKELVLKSPKSWVGGASLDLHCFGAPQTF